MTGMELPVTHVVTFKLVGGDAFHQPVTGVDPVDMSGALAVALEIHGLDEFQLEYFAVRAASCPQAFREHVGPKGAAQ